MNNEEYKILKAKYDYYYQLGKRHEVEGGILFSTDGIEEKIEPQFIFEYDLGRNDVRYELNDLCWDKEQEEEEERQENIWAAVLVIGFLIITLLAIFK